MITAAGLSDAGEGDDASVLNAVAIGSGIGAVAGIGAGVRLLIVGKQRKQAYHQWLLGQPMARRPRLQLGGGGLVLRF